MSERAQLNLRLEGWKEIAKHLGKSVRTVQEYETKLGLPVYRRDGQDKSRVFAVVHEIDEWERRRRTLRASLPLLASDIGSDALAEEPASAGFDKTAGSAPEPPASCEEAAGTLESSNSRPQVSRRQLMIAGIGAIGIGTAAELAVRLVGRKRPPADYRVQGSSLIVLTDDNRVLWQYDFKKTLVPNKLSGTPPSSRCLFADVDGDGRIETLYCWFRREDDKNALACLSESGELLWQFDPGRTIYSALGSEYLPPYGINAFTVLPIHGTLASQVVVNSVHHYSYPCQVAVLDGRTGRLVNEYWHRGHLRSLCVADLDGDAQAEIILGGVNDAEEHRRATVVILDPRRPMGGSRDPAGRPYFRVQPAGAEKAEVFFPRTPLSRGKEFNIVNGLKITEQSLMVRVIEDISDDHCTDELSYEFDRDLRHVEVMFSNPFSEHYRELRDLSKVETLSLAVLAKELQAKVQVSLGPDWTKQGATGS